MDFQRCASRSRGTIFYKSGVRWRQSASSGGGLRCLPSGYTPSRCACSPGIEASVGFIKWQNLRRRLPLAEVVGPVRMWTAAPLAVDTQHHACPHGLLNSLYWPPITLEAHNLIRSVLGVSTQDRERGCAKAPARALPISLQGPFLEQLKIVVVKSDGLHCRRHAKQRSGNFLFTFTC